MEAIQMTGFVFKGIKENLQDSNKKANYLFKPLSIKPQNSTVDKENIPFQMEYVSGIKIATAERRKLVNAKIEEFRKENNWKHSFSRVKKPIVFKKINSQNFRAKKTIFKNDKIHISFEIVDKIN